MKVNEILNLDEIDRLKEDLKDWKDYVPLKFINLTGEDYYNNCNEEALLKYKQSRQSFSGQQYLIDDIHKWVEEYPQFEYILKKEEE